MQGDGLEHSSVECPLFHSSLHVSFKTNISTLLCIRKKQFVKLIFIVTLTHGFTNFSKF